METKESLGIKVDHISFSFISNKRLLKVLEKVDLVVHNGEFISIVGPSGCGKTTLLKVLGGLYHKSSKGVLLEGEIFVNGKTSTEARKDREFGFCFQNPILLPWRNVLKNIELPLEIIGSKVNSSTQDPRSLLRLVGLEEFGSASPEQLSGGMRQRVALARSLVFNPTVLLMDEPFGALDEITRFDMNLELLRIWRETNATVIFVTHSISEAIFLGSRVVVLSARPATISDIIEVPFTRPQSSEQRFSRDFIEIADRVRRILKGANGYENENVSE